MTKQTTTIEAPHLKAGQAAEYLGISRRHLHTLSRAGRLPYARLGTRLCVYRRADLDAFVASRMVG